VVGCPLPDGPQGPLGKAPAGPGLGGAGSAAGLEYLLGGLPPPPEGASDKEYAAYAVAAAQYTQAASALKDGQSLPLLPSVEEATALLRASGAVGPSATSGYPYYGGWGGSGYGGGGRKKEKSKHKDMSWSLEEERKAQEKLKNFWLQLSDKERRELVKIEKAEILKEMKEQQRYICSCSVCGRRRTVLEEELETLYDAYYEELEDAKAGRVGIEGPRDRTAGKQVSKEAPKPPPPPANDDDSDDDDTTFANSLTVKAGKLTVSDELLEDSGRKFFSLIEKLAEKRMKKFDYFDSESCFDGEDVVDSDLYETSDEEDSGSEEEIPDMFSDDDSDYLEEQRMEEGRRMFQLFAAKMFENRLLDAYREKVALEAQEQLIREEEEAEKEKEAKAKLKKEKEKERRKAKKERKKAAKANEEAEKTRKKQEAEEAARLRQQREEEQRKQDLIELKKRRAEEEKARNAELERRAAQLKREKEAREKAEAAQALARVKDAERQAKKEKKAKHATAPALEAENWGEWEAPASKGKKKAAQEAAAAAAKPGPKPGSGLGALSANSALANLAQPPAFSAQASAAIISALGGKTGGPALKKPQPTQPQPIPAAAPRKAPAAPAQHNGNAWAKPLANQGPAPVATTANGSPVFKSQFPTLASTSPGAAPVAVPSAAPVVTSTLTAAAAAAPAFTPASMQKTSSGKELAEAENRTVDAALNNLDSELSDMLDLLPGDLLGTDGSGLGDELAPTKVKEPEADKSWYTGGGFNQGATWGGNPALPGSSMGMSSMGMGGAPPPVSAGFGSPWMQPAAPAKDFGAFANPGMVPDAAAAPADPHRAALERLMGAFHGRVVRGELTLPVDLRTFWMIMNQMDPAAGSKSNVNDILKVWHGWQERNLISIGYNDLVSPPEPFIVAVTPPKQAPSNGWEGKFPSQAAAFARPAQPTNGAPGPGTWGAFDGINLGGGGLGFGGL